MSSSAMGFDHHSATTPLRASSPPPPGANAVKLEPGVHTPASTPTQQRGRRKRVAIEIPADMELENMDPKDVKKIKNRIAAARLRERSQQQIRELQAMVQYYKTRTEYLEGVAAGCVHCSSCVAHVQVPPSDQDFHVLSHHQLASSLSPLDHQALSASRTGSQCHSPASSTEDEYMGGGDDCGISLDDIDCDLLSKLLLMSE